MKLQRTKTLALFALMTVAGCATTFQGSAYIEGGRAECEHKCGEQSLVMSSIVYMGEYSSACVCSVPAPAAEPVAPAPASPAAPAAPGPVPAAPQPEPAAAAAGAGAAGVMMQMRRSQEQNHNIVAFSGY